MRWATIGLAALVLCAAGCSGSTSSDQPSFEPRFLRVECPADVETAVLAPHTCGRLTVLEDRRRPAGPKLQLFVLRVQPPRRPRPGGPIGAVGFEIGQAPDYGGIAGIAEGSGRELILLDQRGVGHSQPSLACSEGEAIARCRDRLTDNGVRLDAFSLAAAADDLEDLRRALGVPRWNLVSWGTASRLLLVYVGRHSTGVRALVLGGPQLPGTDPEADAAAATQDAVDALADAACPRSTCPGYALAAGSPDVIRVVRDLLARGDAGLAGDVIRNVARGKMRRVEQMLHEGDAGCIGYQPRCEGSLSTGAYLSFTCGDRDPEAAAQVTDPYAEACSAWRTAAGEAGELPPTTVPILAVVGAFDPFSPTDAIRTALPSAHVVRVPYAGHDVFGSYDCIRAQRNAWLDDPKSVPKFERCLESIPPPKFGQSGAR